MHTTALFYKHRYIFKDTRSNAACGWKERGRERDQEEEGQNKPREEF